METSTSITLINQRWRLCTMASLLGCFIIIFCLRYQYNGPSLSAFQSIRSTTTTTAAVATIATTTITRMENLSTTTNTYCGTEHRNVANVTYSLMYDGMDSQLMMNESKKECNYFDGRWVYDPKANPSYKASQCPFLSDQVSCRRNGRKDFDYEGWRWEAKGCEIPRLNGKEMLKRLRGKRVIIVGDSLNRNQWESLSCLLYSAIPSRSASVDVRNSHHMIFKARDYNCSVEFYWSPFLVQLDNTQPNGVKVLKLDTLSTYATGWRGADILVFNTGHWWTHRGKFKRWDIFQHEGKLVQNLDVKNAFEIGMKTWARWIDLNVDAAKTTVIFRSISPEHKGEQWCYNQTQPITDNTYKTTFPRPIINIVEKTIREMRTPVKYLNITKLSQYRKDAHPTVYTTKQGMLLTKDQREKPELYADCSHWCLPGVPDTWNSLLFTSIFIESSRDIL